MKRIFAVSLIIFILPLSNIKAEVSLNSELTRCASITRDLQRLACYDALSGLASTSPVEALSKKPTTSIAQKSSEKSVTEATFSIGNQSDSTFGIQKKDDEPESISSYIPGEFKGWGSGDKITLANGQVWKINDTGNRLYHIASNPKVTISKGIFGSYRISVEGVNKSVSVKRIK